MKVAPGEEPVRLCRGAERETGGLQLEPQVRGFGSPDWRQEMQLGDPVDAGGSELACGECKCGDAGARKDRRSAHEVIRQERFRRCDGSGQRAVGQVAVDQRM